MMAVKMEFLMFMEAGITQKRFKKCLFIIVDLFLSTVFFLSNSTDIRNKQLQCILPPMATFLPLSYSVSCQRSLQVSTLQEVQGLWPGRHRFLRQVVASDPVTSQLINISQLHPLTNHTVSYH